MFFSSGIHRVEILDQIFIQIQQWLFGWLFHQVYCWFLLLVRYGTPRDPEESYEVVWRGGIG